MTFSTKQNKVFGTIAERSADTYYLSIVGSKWHCTNTGEEYISDGTFWRLEGEGNPNYQGYGTNKEIR